MDGLRFTDNISTIIYNAASVFMDVKCLYRFPDDFWFKIDDAVWSNSHFNVVHSIKWHHFPSISNTSSMSSICFVISD